MTSAPARDTSSPFHAGEHRVQERLGVREAIEPWARRVVRPELPEEHRRFYAALPYLVVAARDARGRPWASLLTGAPGGVRRRTPCVHGPSCRVSTAYGVVLYSHSTA